MSHLRLQENYLNITFVNCKNQAIPFQEEIMSWEQGCLFQEGDVGKEKGVKLPQKQD